MVVSGKQPPRRQSPKKERVRERDREGKEKEKKRDPEYMPSSCIVCEAANQLFSLSETSPCNMNRVKEGFCISFP